MPSHCHICYENYDREIDGCGMCGYHTCEDCLESFTKQELLDAVKTYEIHKIEDEGDLIGVNHWINLYNDCDDEETLKVCDDCKDPTHVSQDEIIDHLLQKHNESIDQVKKDMIMKNLDYSDISECFESITGKPLKLSQKMKE